MNACRLFVSHEALDQWVANERVSIDGDTLTDHQTGHTFELREGVRFLSEVTGQTDIHGLVGKVKEVEQLVSLGGEHMADSVLLGDNAYQVQSGFVGRPLFAFDVATANTDRPPPGVTVPPKAEIDEKPAAARQTILALQNFFLNNVK